MASELPVLKKIECTGEAKDKGKLYTTTVSVGGDSFTAQHSSDEFENLLLELKKIDKSLFSGFKIPQKKLFKGVSGIFGYRFSLAKLQKQRLGVFSDMISVSLKNQEIFNHELVKQFLNIKDTPKEADDSQDGETTLNLGNSNNTKAKPSDFEFLKVIGKGTFGQVYLAKHKAENQFYAIKVLLKKHILRRNEIKHIMAEKDILIKNINHPFMVTLHYSFQTKEKLYFVLTYVNGGELFYHLQRDRMFSEPRVRFYCAEIGLALEYMHKLNIIYRDLKPENLLLDNEGHIVLTDFGLSKMNIQDDEKTSTFCGTPEYLAPEILMKLPYNKSVDWWCFGCVMYELLHGLPPFYSKDTNAMYNNIVNQPLTFRHQTNAEAKDLLEKLLIKDPTKRLGADQRDFDEIKEHLFFKEIDFDALLAKTLEPPFKPQVSHQGDTVNIDTEFTREPVPASLIPNEDEMTVGGDGNAFQGFTYVPQDE